MHIAGAGHRQLPDLAHLDLHGQLVAVPELPAATRADHQLPVGELDLDTPLHLGIARDVGLVARALDEQHACHAGQLQPVERAGRVQLAGAGWQRRHRAGRHRGLDRCGRRGRCGRRDGRDGRDGCWRCDRGRRCDRCDGCRRRRRCLGGGERASQQQRGQWQEAQCHSDCSRSILDTSRLAVMRVPSRSCTTSWEFSSGVRLSTKSRLTMQPRCTRRKRAGSSRVSKSAMGRRTR
mmetsp:Transcript_657/g.1415  ORF Transcript_657/g.1415 Transcript_657/m.1415 type:complete len:236 (-) Transcript_657:631-1338(-)